MKTKKNYNNIIISVFLSLLFLFNAVFIKPFQVNAVTTDAPESQTESTNKPPETVFKVNNFDSSLIDEQKKHEGVETLIQSNSITNTETTTVNEESVNLKIFCLICANVEYTLSCLNFTVFKAQAYDIMHDCWYDGYVYTDYSIYLEDKVIAGFVTIDNEADIDENSKLIAFNDDKTDANTYWISDNELELYSDHFIVNNKYVRYEWKNCFVVEYSVAENNENNYDKSLGLLYSYDESKYIYDNDFTYTALEVSMMFTEIDFDKLQQTIDEINAEQAKNGYYVQEITITYISSELIDEWEHRDDKNSFYGYDLDELNKTFGPSTTLEFTSDGGIKKATLIEEKKPTNWLKVGLKVATGFAAILIGAAIAPLTGGCSFAASLLCIAKMTAIAMVTDLVVKTAVTTITNVVNGQGFWDALDNSIKSTFTIENIAQSFMTAAIMSSVAVGSGAVKACFIEGTQVLTEDGYRNIETLSIGDKVLSYSELTGAIALKEITATMVNKSDDICTVALDSGETITSTSLHPWFVQGKSWTPAYALTSTDKLLTQSGEEVRILGVNRQILDKPIDVYNITVDKINSEDYHTYYVGTDDVLVHNACSTKKVKVDTNKPIEKHHFLSNKNKKWTPLFKQITDKYGLDLNKPYNGRNWNIEKMYHHGRHATEYHDYMLRQLIKIDKTANGDVNAFLDLFDKVKKTIMDHPEALYKAFWKAGGKLI